MSKYKLPKIQEMLDAGVHFGHQVKRWHPKMEKYIYTTSKNIHIIDLEQTEKMLESACEFLYTQASLGKTIVFVGTKRQSKDIIENEARRCGAMYVNERWVGGTITNFDTIKLNLNKLIDMLKGKEDGRFDIYTKRERLLIDRKIQKFQASYGGIVNLKSSPDILFVIDPKREKTAVREAKISEVPVVAIVDTNADPTEVNYPIPANDDAIKSIALLVKAVSEAIEAGYEEYGKIAEKMEKQKEKEAKKAAEEAAKEAERLALEAEEKFKEVVEAKDEEVKADKIEDLEGEKKVEEKVKKPTKK